MVTPQDTSNLDMIDRQLIQILQDSFPLTPQPYKTIGDKLNLTETEVLNRIERLNQQGVTQKIGAILNQSKVGMAAATLVALKVPHERVEEVAEVINQYSSVSHNYERDHEYNVWFTLKAASQTELDATLNEIAQKAAVPLKNLLSLPTKNCFKINVRFKLA
jgi:siroheme decarboxylase